MIIDLDYEEKKNITTEQATIILDSAAQAASDNGFITSFVFYRAIYVFAAQVLMPDKKDSIAAMIGNGYDIRLAFDKLASDGTFRTMVQKYPTDIEFLINEGNLWLEEVKGYQQSARGILDSINTFSGDILKSAVNQLQEVASGDLETINNFVDKWGFNRPTPGENSNIPLEKTQEALKLVENDKA